MPRNPPPPVTSTAEFTLPHDSLLAAQTASFSRKILALWRMSTGNARWKRIVWIRLVCANASASLEQLRADAVPLGPRQSPADAARRRARASSRRARFDTDQGRAATAGWVLKIASHGIVKSVSSAGITRCDLRPQNQIRPCSSR